MKHFTSLKKDLEDISIILKNGGVGVLLTDTIYGIVGSARHPQAVERIYEIKKRPKEKRLIILAESLDDIKSLGVLIPENIKDFLDNIWPGQITIRFEITDKTPSYLHRGLDTLAFRIPAKRSLLELLKKTGPIVAPSANVSGDNPAHNILEVEKIFKDKVDFYVDEGEVIGEPSTILSVNLNEINIIRKGVVPKEKILEIWNLSQN